MKALLSVSNKTGIEKFAEGLLEQGFELYSTGGTFKALKDADIAVKQVSDLTHFNEIMDGRVKTLHPAVHGGILADRDNAAHMKDLSDNNIETIDLVAVNLYPFKETVRKADVRESDAVENIDIGGPTMLRAAAKNYKHVTTVVDPFDYDEVLNRLKDKTLDEQFRKQLMIKVFRHTNDYDQAIVNFFAQSEKTLRYGENPHQSAKYVKTTDDKNTILNADVLHGKELSYNNLRDADSAFALAKKFDLPAAVAVKHMNPCGVGTGETIAEAFQNAFDADNQSIFGGIVALNKTVDEDTAEKLSKVFLEVIIAPHFSEEALNILTKKKNIRLLQVDFTEDQSSDEFVSVSGGYLVQSTDSGRLDKESLEYVTDNQPDEEQLKALALAWEVSKHVKSNAIVLANSKQTVGIGAGQMNRVGALKIAAERAIELGDNVVMASDGFFPMPDTVEFAHAQGITAIIQPGGSKRDNESIDFCNENGIAMVFTGMRHFKH
ncbi:Bifunctional purine biosynthesis protein PurH [Jeotgalicoccus aerolatus]|uniref:Bifunctional purine biosynthesis protein PurH n=1 Tax=Jeotgalicoccus aerolatus TaxID=709510 RepID=A0A1G8YMR0_9STAP|nr:bifunctional phosphoribosylaminoimidazolecarboxamide formyltransferase/IMP cyclohydrolase [Jeotgalicoccus aerolatus]MBP1952826.1 phosphoribosylaminoimidazolecarboxamide formyltransferase/IMP cyclohydrolase [Jeotgalicoccus aerolatus]CAD2080599.1 Bifunctional purine biosynthesis protein PurH [Jeotgalicoccus aerolatus]SDK03734.1 phosphoribosylaminoimidazolecarboxamide formyltransferase / IMP cyclohydrolase [Jeotgalicoccus aerolatus]GGE07756.1 bifunctional purine biosynthesis protein PurH [Jeotg